MKLTTKDYKIKAVSGIRASLSPQTRISLSIEGFIRRASKTIIKIKLDKSKKLWYNSCTKKKTKLKKQQEKNT